MFSQSASKAQPHMISAECCKTLQVGSCHADSGSVAHTSQPSQDAWTRFYRVRFLLVASCMLSLLPRLASAQQFSEFKKAEIPERGIVKESVARIKIRDEENRYITFVEVEREEVYRSVMDCNEWRTRRYTVNGGRPYDQPKFFYENIASLNHIRAQAEYCQETSKLPLANIDYEKGMRSQVWKDRGLLPQEYFLKCPQKDANWWACIDYRDEWEGHRWDPRPAAAVQEPTK